MQPAPLILLVDDDDGVRLTLRDYLEHKGHQVVVSSDGVGAIKLLLDHEIALILTDFRMEPLGGDYWIRFLRRFCPDLPVLVMSGLLDSEMGVPYEVFAKPFDYGDLERRVRELLGAGQSDGA